MNIVTQVSNQPPQRQQFMLVKRPCLPHALAFAQEHIVLGDGMGGVEEEVIVTKPIGGKASIQLITNGKPAASDALPQVPSSANFPVKDPASSNDGLGGSQQPLSRLPVEASLNPNGKSTDMALNVKRDDGLGAITTPDALKGTNAEPRSKGLPLKEKSDGVGGSGKKMPKAVVPQQAAERFMAKVAGNDGLGAQQGYREAAAAGARARQEVQGTQLALHAKDTSDGLGGFRRVAAAATAAAAAAASASAAAAAAGGSSASGKK